MEFYEHSCFSEQPSFNLHTDPSVAFIDERHITDMYPQFATPQKSSKSITNAYDYTNFGSDTPLLSWPISLEDPLHSLEQSVSSPLTLNPPSPSHSISSASTTSLPTPSSSRLSSPAPFIFDSFDDGLFPNFDSSSPLSFINDFKYDFIDDVFAQGLTKPSKCNITPSVQPLPVTPLKEDYPPTFTPSPLVFPELDADEITASYRALVAELEAKLEHEPEWDEFLRQMSESCSTPSPKPNKPSHSPIIRRPKSLPSVEDKSRWVHCKWADCGGWFFLTPRAITKHFRKYHPLKLATEIQRCEWNDCQKECAYLRRHLDAHIPVRTCSRCGEAFLRSDTCRRHEKSQVCTPVELRDGRPRRRYTKRSTPVKPSRPTPY